MSWQISGGSAVTITFPVNPQDVLDENPIIETDVQVDGQQSAIISEGLDVRTLTLKGFFWVSGQNKNYLDTNFVLPLLGLNGLQVWLSCPINRYNGKYVLIVKSVEEKAEGLLQRYIYTLQLKQGAGYVVLI